MVGINSNLIAGSATRNLGAANSVVSSSVARLSSGNRIIKASDDVAGLAIGTSIQSTVKTLEIALLNTQQANSVLSIADGALAQIGDILTRQNSLASQANSGSLGATERGFLNQEFQALISEIDRIVTATQFNGITLLNGSLGSSAGLDVASTAAGNTYIDSGTVGTAALDGSTFTILNTNDNLNLIGSTSDIVVTGSNAGAADGTEVKFSLTLGGKIYTTSGNTDVTTSDTNRTLTFTSVDSSAHTITVTLDTYTGGTTQGVVNTIAANIQADLDALTINQVRTFSTTTGGIPSTNADGTVLAGLSGSNVTLSSTDFDVVNNTAPVIGAFNVTAFVTATSSFSASTTIGGVAYSTTATTNAVVDAASGVALETLDLDDAGSGTGVLRLYKGGDATTNPNDYIEINLVPATLNAINAGSVENAQTLETALNSLFGVGNNGALSFQVGANVTDSISVSISSALTTTIYADDNGDVQTLDITTQANAQQAIEVVGNAISTVIGRRADVGAAISRFNFAASNLEVSISNQDAARGSFLDADVATESTNFATAQVKLQASIAVLAQANALPRNLLTLLQ